MIADRVLLITGQRGFWIWWMLPFSFPFPFGCGSADVLWGGVFELDFDMGVKVFADAVFAIFRGKFSDFRAGVVIPADVVRVLIVVFCLATWRGSMLNGLIRL